MPYITPQQRKELLSRPPIVVGELNYVIHLELFREYIDEKAIVAIIDIYLHGREASDLLYYSIMGVLECVYWEFAEREPEKPSLYHVADAMSKIQSWFYNKYLLPHEKQKRNLNGDVYPPGGKQ